MIDINNFDLKLVNCLKFDGYSFDNDVEMLRRKVYDYEFEYYTASEGKIEINGKKIPFHKGEINFRKPSQIVMGIRPYSCYCIGIDLFGDKRKKNGEYGFGKEEYMQPLYKDTFLNQIPDKIDVKKSELLGLIIKNIYDYNILNNVFMLKSELYRLFHELHRFYSKEAGLTVYNTTVKNAIIIMKESFSGEINYCAISDNVGVSQNYFFRIFKECTGITPNKFILNLRISKAKVLLETTDMKISDIGYECGFYDSVYFSYVFKRETGITPRAFRNSSITWGNTIHR